MDDLDGALARLAGAPTPLALDGIEAKVLARIGVRSSARGAGIGIGSLTIAALAIGMVGGGVPATASSVPSLEPLGGGSPLAPSTLLAGTP